VDGDDFYVAELWAAPDGVVWREAGGLISPRFLHHYERGTVIGTGPWHIGRATFRELGVLDMIWWDVHDPWVAALKAGTMDYDSGSARRHAASDFGLKLRVLRKSWR